MKLRGNGIWGDILIVRRERISRQAEGADPKTGSDIHLAISCQHQPC